MLLWGRLNDAITSGRSVVACGKFAPFLSFWQSIFLRNCLVQILRRTSWSTRPRQKPFESARLRDVCDHMKKSAGVTCLTDDGYGYRMSIQNSAENTRKALNPVQWMSSPSLERILIITPKIGKRVIFIIKLVVFSSIMPSH